MINNLICRLFGHGRMLPIIEIRGNVFLKQCERCKTCDTGYL